MDDVETLRRQLAAMKLALATAEAERVKAQEEAKLAAERATTAEEETLRATAEANLAAERATTAEAERVKAQEETFCERFNSFAASAAPESGSTGDVSRRGVPISAVCALPDVVRAARPVDLATPTATKDEKAAWAWLLRRKPTVAGAPPSTSVGEVKDVHPIVREVIYAALPERGWRYWGDKIVPDDIRSAQAKPDGVFTHERDAQPSLIGAAFMLEVKKPGDMATAERQALAYARRRLYKVFLECRGRADCSPSLLAGLSSLVAATDGEQISFLRVRSGAPEDGRSYAGCTPCPSDKCAPLLLLPGFTGRGSYTLPIKVPAGFVALYRVLHAGPDALSPATPLLSQLPVLHDWPTKLSTPCVDGAAPVHKVLTLGHRLGVGGTSDVYEVNGSADGGGAGGGASGSSSLVASSGVVRLVKLPRHTSEAICKQFEAEFKALRALASACPNLGLFPVGVALCEREFQVRALRTPACPWPALVTSSLVGCRLEEKVPCFESTGLARVRFADKVISRVLKALSIAHSLDPPLVHCDVRPANMVVVTSGGSDEAALVDWGLCLPSGGNGLCRGVAAFAADGVFTSSSYAVCPKMDLLAAAYSWVAIVYGTPDLRPPWAVCTVDEMDEDRRNWLADHTEWLGIATVRDFVDRAGTMEFTTRGYEDLYNWKSTGDEPGSTCDGEST